MNRIVEPCWTSSSKLALLWSRSSDHLGMDGSKMVLLTPYDRPCSVQFVLVPRKRSPPPVPVRAKSPLLARGASPGRRSDPRRDPGPRGSRRMEHDRRRSPAGRRRPSPPLRGRGYSPPGPRRRPVSPLPSRRRWEQRLIISSFTQSHLRWLLMGMCVHRQKHINAS